VLEADTPEGGTPEDALATVINVFVTETSDTELSEEVSVKELATTAVVSDTVIDVAAAEVVDDGEVVAAA